MEVRKANITVRWLFFNGVLDQVTGKINESCFTDWKIVVRMGKIS